MTLSKFQVALINLAFLASAPQQEDKKHEKACSAAQASLDSILTDPFMMQEMEALEKEGLVKTEEDGLITVTPKGQTFCHNARFTGAQKISRMNFNPMSLLRQFFATSMKLRGAVDKGRLVIAKDQNNYKGFQELHEWLGKTLENAPETLPEPKPAEKTEAA